MAREVYVGLDEEIYYMQGVVEGQVQAEVILPLSLVIQKSEEIEALKEQIVGVVFESRIYTVKEMVDKFIEFGRVKDLTNNLVDQFNEEVDARIKAIDKTIKIAINTGVTQKGTEWEYIGRYDRIEVSSVLTEEDRENYRAYYE